MTNKVQMALSDEEDKIVEVYRIENTKKNNEEAMKKFVQDYKPISKYNEENKEITMDNSEEKKMGNNGGSMLISLAIGAVIGLVVGFLYAPKAGKETRKIIKDKAQSTKDKAVEIVQQIKKVSSDEVEIAKKNLGEYIEEARVPITSSAKKGNGGSKVI
jgi:gas vesicle protein